MDSAGASTPSHARSKSPATRAPSAASGDGAGARPRFSRAFIRDSTRSAGGGRRFAGGRARGGMTIIVRPPRARGRLPPAVSGRQAGGQKSPGGGRPLSGSSGGVRFEALHVDAVFAGEPPEGAAVLPRGLRRPRDVPLVGAEQVPYVLPLELGDEARPGLLRDCARGGGRAAGRERVAPRDERNLFDLGEQRRADADQLPQAELFLERLRERLAPARVFQPPPDARRASTPLSGGVMKSATPSLGRSNTSQVFCGGCGARKGAGERRKGTRRQRGRPAASRADASLLT